MPAARVPLSWRVARYLQSKLIKDDEKKEIKQKFLVDRVGNNWISKMNGQCYLSITLQQYRAHCCRLIEHDYKIVQAAELSKRAHISEHRSAEFWNNRDLPNKKLVTQIHA